MRRLLSMILLAALLICGACHKKDFKLEFSFPETISGNFNVVYFSKHGDDATLVQTVAAVQEGKYLLEGATDGPTLLYLYQGNARLPILFYVNGGDRLKITGENLDPATWVVTGNNISERIAEWRAVSGEAFHHSDQSSGGRQGNDAVNKEVAEYVASNPEDPVSTLLLLTFYDRSRDEKGFRELWESLDGEAGDPAWLRLVGRSDVTSRKLNHEGALRSIVMRAFPSGVDTIMTDSVDAVMLYFWDQNTVQGGAGNFNAIKTLKEEFSDSSKRIIADVFVEADSVMWRSQLRRDTLENVARLWVPAGIADRQLMKLGVTATPFYIVFQRGGEQAYRGNQPDSALNVFRRLMKGSENEKDTVSKPESKKHETDKPGK